MDAITAEGLVKIYRSRKSEVRALDGLDLTVKEGTVLGLLGPNGAGKTTTVRILATLLRPDAGHATVAGFDVVKQADQLRSVIGLSGQFAAVDENLTGRENLWMFGRLYQLRSAESARRAAALLEQFGLADAAERTVKTYSGGMRRRLDLASALIGRPRLLFLDEPTTGLDPRSRLGMWDVIRDLVRAGTTLLLTTQYLEEADELADTIAVVDGGRIIARGTADELKSQVGGERIEVVVHDRADLGRAEEKGIIDRFRSLPMATSAVLTGRTLADVVYNGGILVVLMLSGLVVGWRVHTGLPEFLAGVGLLLLFAFTMSWIGVGLGLSVPTVEVAQQVSFIVIFPLSFVSNAFVPIGSMPDFLQPIAEWNPISSITAACRQLWGDPNPFVNAGSFPSEHPVLLSLVWMAVLLAVFAPLGVRRYRSMSR